MANHVHIDIRTHAAIVLCLAGLTAGARCSAQNAMMGASSPDDLKRLIKTQTSSADLAGLERAAGSADCTEALAASWEMVRRHQAQREAETLRHKYLGTEHLLLALMIENEALTAAIASDGGASIADVRDAIVRELQPKSLTNSIPWQRQ